MATRTVSNAGGNWNAVGAWVGGVVPITGDDIAFTATSGNLTVNVNTAVLIGVNLTNYLGTITFTQTINTSGFLNLGTGGYTQGGANGIVLNNNTTLTSGGVTWSRTLTFGGTSATYTFVGNWTSTGLITFSAGGTTTLTNNTLNINGNLTQSSPGGIYTGTTAIVFGGTGTWINSSTGAIRNNVTINTAGTRTMSGNLYYDTGIFTYTAGTVVTTGSTLQVAAATTFNTGTFTFNNFTTAGTTYTITLSSNLNITGTLTLTHTGTLSFSGAFTFNPTGALVVTQGTTTIPNTLNITNATLINSNTNAVLNTNTINISGNLTTSSTGICSGTTTLVLTGTGTWSNSTSGSIRNNLTINAGANTITVSGTVRYDTGTLTYTSGTVTTTGSTLNIGTSTTFATNGMSWNNVTFAGGGGVIHTFSNNFDIDGNLILSNSGAFTTLNGNTITVGGNITQSNAIVVSGTTNIVMDGTGTWSNSTVGVLRNNLTINTVGTITISGTVYYDTGTLTYTAGTVTTTGSTLNIGALTTLNTNGITWNNFTTAGGVYTITLSSNLNITGTLTLSHTGTISFSGAFTFNPTGDLIVSGSGVTNVPNTLNVVNATLTTSSGTRTLNTNTINVSGNLTLNSTGACTGTTSIVLTGTGTWSNPSTATLQNNLTFNNGVNTFTVSGTVRYAVGTITYTSGTVTTSGSTLLISSTTTLATNGMSWDNITIAGAASYIVTLSNDLTATGNLIFSTTGSSTLTLSGNKVFVGGNLEHSGFNLSITGTTTIELNGTGTWSRGLASSTGALSNNLIINTPGTITVSGTVSYGSGTLTYTAGTVIATGSTLLIPASNPSFNTNGMSWGNISSNIGSALTNTFTLISPLTADSLTFLSGNVIFLTSGFTVGTISATTSAGQTYQLASGTTNTITTDFTCTAATNASRVLFRSTTPGVQAILTVQPGATINVGFVNATDIDSSLGRTVYSYRGVFSNTLNWSLLPVDVTTTAFTFIS